MRLILTLKSHYQHTSRRSSCRLWDSMDDCLSISETGLHIPTRLDFSSHHADALKCSISNLRSDWIIYCFLQSWQRCNVCVNNISHSQGLISFEMVQSTDDSYDSCSSVLFFEAIFPDAFTAWDVWQTAVLWYAAAAVWYIIWYIHYSLQEAYTVKCSIMSALSIYIAYKLYNIT